MSLASGGFYAGIWWVCECCLGREALPHPGPSSRRGKLGGEGESARPEAGGVPVGFKGVLSAALTDEFCDEADTPVAIVVQRVVAALEGVRDGVSGALARVERGCDAGLSGGVGVGR